MAAADARDFGDKFLAMECTLEAETLVSNLTQYKLFIGDDKKMRFLECPSPLNDMHLHCHNKRILISDNQMSYNVMFYMLGETSVPVFDSRVFATLVPGKNNSNYYHSLYTSGCELCNFEVFAVFQKGPCYSCPMLYILQ